MKSKSIFTLIAILLLNSCTQKKYYTQIRGFAQGTTYAITYEGTDTLQGEVERLLARFDSSLSIYNPASIISKVNRNEAVAADSFFAGCFALAQRISAQTGGAFDMSAEPLFRAWGFGSVQHSAPPTAAQVDSLRAFCGMDKIRIEGNRVLKADPRIQLNANAIAKGYAVDAVARLLEAKGKSSYLVEIGGEIFCRGANAKGAAWLVGIDRPADGNFVPGQDMQARIRFSGRGLATSGNYRKFYMRDGKKVAHTISPLTGFPAYNSLLSATVLAAGCGEADGFATALMVLGLDSAKAVLARHPQVDAYLIYAPDSGGYATYATAGFERRLVQ